MLLSALIYFLDQSRAGILNKQDNKLGSGYRLQFSISSPKYTYLQACYYLM